MKTLGQYIRELREKKDISLRELAKKLDVSAAFVSDIELGRRFPSEKVLARLASALDVSVENLRQYDARVPFEDLRRLAEASPAYGLAFRKLVDKKVTPEELMKLANKKEGPKNKE